MITRFALASLGILTATASAWAHNAPVEHAHAGGLTLYAVPAMVIGAVAVLLGLVIFTVRSSRKDG